MALRRELLIALVAGVVATGCGPIGEEGFMTITDEITVSSSAFTEGASIPERHTCDGEDVSPPLAWSGAPEGTAAYVLLVDDPDARSFVHWVVSDIPAEVTDVAEGSGGGGVEGRNDFGRHGWAGPCPPSGTHRYVVTVYALSQALGLEPGAEAGAVRRAMEGKVLAQGRLVGTYRRNS
jgi:Raf kinase inhibitor-like YbhB/YbcL family protein